MPIYLHLFDALVMLDPYLKFKDSEIMYSDVITAPTLETSKLTLVNNVHTSRLAPLTAHRQFSTPYYFMLEFTPSPNTSLFAISLGLCKCAGVSK